MTTNNRKITSLALGLCVLLGASACSDDDSSDSPDSGSEGGRVSRAGSGGKGGAGGSGSGDDDCFDGDAEETEQFLNHCTDSECQAFDNAKRLPLFKDGKLPALP